MRLEIDLKIRLVVYEIMERTDTEPSNQNNQANQDHKFWNNQPVSKLSEKISIDGEITELNPDEIREVPYPLPEAYEWVSLDASKPEDLETVSKFLQKHYRSEDSKFKIHYSSNFIKWNLCPPSSPTDLNLGVRVKSNGILVSFIGGVETNLQVNNRKLNFIDVNFLCIHPKLRNNRLAPVMIKEFTRRCNLRGFSRGFFSTKKQIAKPFYNTSYHHRAINPKILVNTGFSKLEDNVTLKMMKRTYKLPESTSNSNFVPLREEHLEEAYEIFNNYMDKYNFHPIYNFAEFSHIFFGNDFVTCYVLLDDDDCVVDMVSYYKLPYLCLKDKKYEFINAGYLFYYTSSYETPYRLINDILVIARDEGVAVFNATTVMENRDILKELSFVEGPGQTNFYFYNWKCRNLEDNQVAKIVF